MKRKLTIYVRPRWSILLMLLATAVIVLLGVFLFFRVHTKNKAYQEYVSTIPAAAEVGAMDVYIQNDGTLIFYAEGFYSFAVLNENSQMGALQPFTVGGNTINAVFVSVATDSVKETVLSAMEQGIDIRNLFIPEGTDQKFLDMFIEQTRQGKVIICSGGEYQLFKDAAVYVLNGKESLSLMITHGNNTFLYSHDKKVGNMLNQKEATVCIMPYDIFIDSYLNTEYALFPDSKGDIEKLRKKTDYYAATYGNSDMFCLSNGNQISFDVYFNATGRLEGEENP